MGGPTPQRQCAQSLRSAVRAAGHSEGDTFIPVGHSKRLHAAYGGEDKELMLFDGDHNTARPKAFYARALTFLHCALRCDAAALDAKPAGCVQGAGFRADLHGQISL